MGGTFPNALFLTDAGRVKDPLAVAARLPTGTGVIFRDYGLANREALAAGLAAVCRARGLALLIGADWRLALEIGADGVHLPRWAQQGPVPGPLPRDFLVTASVHSRSELSRAEAIGAGAVLISPVFPTKGIGEGEALGLYRFLKLARASRLPFYALGGLTAETLKRLPPHRRFFGAAGISLFADAN